MGVSLYRTVKMGDMQALYFLEETERHMSLTLLPEGMEPVPWENKKQAADSLVQAYVRGDDLPGAYSGGKTMRSGGTVWGMRFCQQKCETDAAGNIVVETMLQSPHGHFCHYLKYLAHTGAAESWTEFFNTGKKAVTLEMLSSFSISGITPLAAGAAPGQLRIHRLRSDWSMEGRLVTERLERLNLEPSWAGHGVRSERFGQAGSMPVNKWFPWLLVEDVKNHLFWGAQLGHNASWQMEVYRKDDGAAISGGLADYEFGHWAKTVRPDESFRTPAATLTVCKCDTIDEASDRLVSAMRVPDIASEQELPILFNEYCTTWGCPSHENIANILSAIQDKGISYFVIDSGWYKPDGISWENALGDWRVSKELFPEGLEKTVAAIKEAGMTPGIWFEPETAGKASEAYRQEEHMLTRNGAVITTAGRRFWDLRDPWVRDYLRERVIEFLKSYGFGYVKIDYNDTVGIGCDKAESLGEGLRQNMEASFEFFQEMQRCIPGLVIENCSSGGHRLEPKMLSATAMSSFSDAHECTAIPIIAANLHRVMQPRQSQIWAVIQQKDSLTRIAYSMSATLLGRCCLSGHVTELTAEQWKTIEDGIAFYKAAAPVIKAGRSYRFGPEILSYNEPEGWQGMLRVGNQGESLLVIHMFGGELPECVSLRLPKNTRTEVQSVYDACHSKYQISDGVFQWCPKETFSSIALLLA